MTEPKIKIAILDMYDGTPNLGMQAIRDIVSKFDKLEVKEYDVRGQCEVPGLDYDLYLSTGGPGSPLEGGGIWERAYYYFLEKLWRHNQLSEEKKYAFFICHSFQIVCQFLSLGSVVYRKSPSAGVLRMRLTEEGKKERTFHNLPDPFYAADFREWQFIEADLERMKRLGCRILALEKDRPHVPLERAVMAIRFSPEWIGTQFHPEADPEGMLRHLNDPKKKQDLIEQKGEEKYRRMLENTTKPDRLQMTFDHVLPQFLEQGIESIRRQRSLLNT